jgi:hypothetical protein
MYHCFPNKDALVQAVISYHADVIADNQRQANLGSAGGLRAWRDMVIAQARSGEGKGGRPVEDPRPLGAVSAAAALPRLVGGVRGQYVGAGLAGVARDGLALGDGGDVADTALLLPVPEAAVLAVGLVRGHPGGRDARVQCPAQHQPGKIGLGGELHVVGDARISPHAVEIRTSVQVSRHVYGGSVAVLSLPGDRQESEVAASGRSRCQCRCASPPRTEVPPGTVRQRAVADHDC